MKLKPYRRSPHSLTFWRANKHPFLARVARPKDCSFCDQGKTNEIHVEPERQPFAKKRKK